MNLLPNLQNHGELHRTYRLKENVGLFLKLRYKGYTDPRNPASVEGSPWENSLED